MKPTCATADLRDREAHAHTTAMSVLIRHANHPPLPIDDALPALLDALSVGTSAVLVAPPGAGKTTRVPLALLDCPWRGDGRILVLEPRRLAARGAADRMARTLGERLGETVGIRARLGTRVSARTRIEVVTEGVFTRMILDDPSLEGVAAVLFDEYHERSLDADLGLALALDARAGLREDLRILVMSATLDGARVAALLGDGFDSGPSLSEPTSYVPVTVPIIESAGRMYPVETRYAGRELTRRLEDEMAAVIVRALSAEDGSILAFLPGQGEIRRVEERLIEAVRDPSVDIAPLYGAMDPAAQDRAVEPARPGRRKIVLATSIAETSLTIEGVRVVIDSGLARVPRYEADSGLTRLQTVRVSRASADQRRGRAGRTEPGVCYRLWDEPQTLALIPFSDPEIRAAGLASLVLDCAEWGTSDPLSLRWLDPPPLASLMAARAELTTLRAIDGDGRITELGRRIRALPLPPRLAAMVISAAQFGAALDAAEIAALVVERGLGGADADLSTRLVNFRRDRSRRADDARGLARRWADAAVAGSSTGAAGGTRKSATGARADTAALLALAYPDRIAKQRDGARDATRGHYLLANGRGAYLDPTAPLSASPWLVVAELQGTAARARILLAAPASEADVLAFAGDRIVEADEVAFDDTALAVRARRVRRLDCILIAAEPRRLKAGPDVATALARGIGQLGLGQLGSGQIGADGSGIARLPWSKAHLQLRDRVAFLAASGFTELPNLTDARLAATTEVWLAPYLAGKSRLDEITAADLGAAIEALLPWTARQLVDAEAPTHFTAPTGNAHTIDYEGPQAPALHIRVQELFGLTRHPAIARGNRPLTLNLLSPASRPIQITKDLPSFWSGSWAAVKADMKGRYPRHPWPDDPANAVPTARAKPRGT